MALSISLLGDLPIQPAPPTIFEQISTKIAALVAPTIPTAPTVDPWAVPTTPAPTVSPTLAPTPPSRVKLLRNVVVGGVLVLGGYVVYSLLAPKKAPAAKPVS